VRLLHELRILDTGDEPASTRSRACASLLTALPDRRVSLVDADRSGSRPASAWPMVERRGHESSARTAILSTICWCQQHARRPALRRPSAGARRAAGALLRARADRRRGLASARSAASTTARSSTRRARLARPGELTGQLLQTAARARWRLQKPGPCRSRRQRWLWNRCRRLTWLTDNLQLRGARPRHVLASLAAALRGMACAAGRVARCTAFCARAFTRFTDWLGRRTAHRVEQASRCSTASKSGLSRIGRDVTAELEVKQSLARPRSAGSSRSRCSQGVWDWTRAEGLFFSDAWKAIVGHASHEVGTHLKEWLSRIHPDDLADAKAKLIAHLRGDTPLYVVEHRMRHKNGHDVWVLNSGRVVRRARSGRALRMVGTLIDVTASASPSTASATSARPSWRMWPRANSSRA
jgi:PAS domain S-box-containing protein